MICGVFFLQLRQDVQIVEVKPQASAWDQFLQLYIIPSERMQGLGRSFLAGLLTWGAQHGVREIRLEADKGQAAANSFWLRMPLRLDSSSNRNVYHGDLEQ